MAAVYDEDYFERRGWPNYEYSQYWPNLVRKMVDMLPFPPKRVCDIGCAKGYVVHEFRKMGIEAYGVDISDYAISRSFEATRPFLRKADLNKDKLPFDDESFDLLTCMAVIEHLIDVDHALGEFNRVLRAGGIMVVTTPNPGEWDFDTDTDPTHTNIHDQSFWKEKFGSHGFILGEAVPLSRGRILRHFPSQKTLRRTAFRMRRWGDPNKGWGTGVYGFLVTKRRV